MAHKKGVGSTDNGRDSNPKYLGVKLFGGQYAKPGSIIVRQRGTRFHAGDNVYMGKDHTLHAEIEGTVTFKKKRLDRTYISILPLGEVKEDKAASNGNAKAKAAPKAAAAKSTPTKKEATKVESAKVAPAKKEAPKAEPSTTDAVSTDFVKGNAEGSDDLKKIEGIGPKIAELLTDAGYGTFAALSETSVENIASILAAAGSRYTMHNPGSWPAQAKMAADGEWDKLKVWQDELDGGK